MINNLLNILPGDGGSYAGQTQSTGNYYFDNFGEAALYALIGFMVVFVGIILIIAVIWLVGLIMRKTNNLAFITSLKSGKAKEKADKKSSATNTTEKNVTTDNNAVADNEIPAEVKAAIVAAIMAYYEQEQAETQKCQFVVKRIKRIN
jgi:Na+-transporting methylmalonyl-CoA/oxaloacetate decarboxylase gamma subunit